MKSIFATLIITLSILKGATYAQSTISSPNTETAFLNYDYRFQRSGYEKVEGRMIYNYLKQPLKLYFTIESLYDYMFVAMCDSSTEGLRAEFYVDNESSPFVISDGSEIIPEYNSKITLVPLNHNSHYGTITVILELQGKVAANEPSYYLLVRKKKTD